jgi:hypothetical protein
MHVEAQQTDRDLLPDIVSQLLDRHDQRRTVRCEAWCHNTAGRDLRAPYERMAAAAERTADRSRGHDVDGFAL